MTVDLQPSRNGQRRTRPLSARRNGDVAGVDRPDVHARARAAVGVTGDDRPPRMRDALRESGASWYPLVALGLLVVVDEFQQVALTVLAPDISGALGLSKSAFAFAITLKTLAITLAVLPMAAFVQKRPRRAAVSIVTAFAWSLLTIATGYVISIWGLLAVMVADGSSTGSVRAVHEPLLVDSYPTSVRMRVLAWYRNFNNAGAILCPLLIAVVTGVFGFTWRGVFVISGIICAAVAMIALRLRDPGFGRWDTEIVRRTVRDAVGADEPGPGDDYQLGFFEITRRLLMIPTIRRLLTATAVLGMLLVPFTTFLSFFLSERWGLGASERALFSAVMPVFSITALSIFAKRAEAMFRQDPGKVVRLAGVLLAIAVTAIALAIFAPVFPLVVLLFGTAIAATTATAPAMTMAMFAIVPANMRPHMAALSGIFLAGVGALSGLVLLGGIDRRFGTGGAILSLVIPGVIAGLILRSAGRLIGSDLDRMLAGIIEEEELRQARAAGRTPPLLACTNINFSYGQLQVLFDVDFSVDEGEIVALLGTNGAGKSTLLRVISGLGLPSRGSVRLAGNDVTFLDGDRRVRLGISQIPGGRAVFGPMTVDENLRALAYSLAGDRRRINEGIDAALEAFPRLGERRYQLASTLSGGEQQMLGLATAFIVQPRLLLIDELSLGLAPKIVGELLEMVRVINARGTAIVLVEQSVNVALSVVDHAYFMEKGEIRFDGRATDLLNRPDLLRSVFLEGASRGLSGGDDS